MLNVLYACFEAIWRRWFGGGLDFLPNNRFFQHLIGFIVTFLMLHFNNYNIICNILACFALQGLFWAKGHGAFFDYGHGKVDQKRYEEFWCWNEIKEIIPQNMYYGYACDFLLMTIRYTLPSIVIWVILLNPCFLFAGLSVSGIYAFMWALYDLKITKNPTEWAEFLSGLIVGLLLVV